MILTMPTGISEEVERFETAVLHGGVRVDVKLRDGRWLRGRVVRHTIPEWMILQDDPLSYEVADVAEVIVH